MSKTGWLVLGGAIVLALYSVGSYALAGLNLVFLPGSVSSVVMSGANPLITFTIQVQNTSSTSLTINSLAGNIIANGTLIGNISSFTPTTIPPGVTLLPVTANLQAVSLVSSILNIFQNNSGSQALALQGSANVGGIPVPLNLTYTIGTP